MSTYHETSWADVAALAVLLFCFTSMVIAGLVTDTNEPIACDCECP